MRPLKALAETASELRDVLPRPFLERFDTLQAVRKVRALYEELAS